MKANFFCVILAFQLFWLFAAGSEVQRKSTDTQDIFSTSQIEKLIPDSTSDLSGGTQIVIRTDKKKAKVFINGEFSGLTPLTISNLIEGTYNIKLAFAETEKFYELEVKKNLKQNFYIELFTNNNNATVQSDKTTKYKIQHGPLAE